MRIIGITGGIGSGKTTVCSIFAAMGVPVYAADDRAKEVMTTDAQLVHQIKQYFGEGAYLEDELNRPFLAQQVFGDKDKLEVLNSLVHPAVARDFLQWTIAHAHFSYVVKEAAILFESGAYKAVNEVVLVSAPEELRLQRVMQRDGISDAEVRQRMASQWTEERKAALAHHSIINDDHHLVIPQVVALHNQFHK